MTLSEPPRKRTGSLYVYVRAAKPYPMTNPNDAEESVRRVRRGCTFVALLFVAFAVLYTSATGNLAFLLLLVVAAAILLFARSVR